jgi:hypothetical protein
MGFCININSIASSLSCNTCQYRVRHYQLDKACVVCKMQNHKALSLWAQLSIKVLLLLFYLMSLLLLLQQQQYSSTVTI